MVTHLSSQNSSAHGMQATATLMSGGTVQVLLGFDLQIRERLVVLNLQLFNTCANKREKTFDPLSDFTVNLHNEYTVGYLVL